MTTSVYKYPIPIDDYFSLEMPAGAKLLHVEVQFDQPCLWALVDLDQPPEPRQFRLVGTGHQVGETPQQLTHVGSFLLYRGELVFHLFELERGWV